MSRKIIVPNIDNVCANYLGGMTPKKIGDAIGLNEKIIVRALKVAGVFESRRRVIKIDISELSALYLGGESVLSLSKKYCIARSGIERRLIQCGIRIRGGSEACAISASRATAEERLRRATPAHNAVRGSKRSEADLIKRAIGNEITGSRRSHLETLVADVIGGRATFQKACGKYNIDIAIHNSIAVEVYGGGWHLSGRHAAMHNERVRYLLDSGWHVVIVWIFRNNKPLWIDALKNTISELESAYSNPSSIRQYRVIWRSGKLLSRSRDDGDDFPLKPASVVGLNIRSQNNGSGN